MTLPDPAAYPIPDDLFERVTRVGFLAVLFFDTLRAGEIPSATCSLLTNTYLQALLLGSIPEEEELPLDNPP